MRKLFLFLLLLAPVIASGQKRVYIRKDEFKDDIYVIERKGNIEAYFQVDILAAYDSLFLLVTKENVQEVHDYMVALRDTYKKWSKTAKRNDVKNFEKEIDIESPLVRFRWMERTEATGFRLYIPMIEYYSTEGRWFKPSFRVNNVGRCNIYVDYSLTCDDARYRKKYEGWFPLHDDEINRIIRWTSDFNEIERIYNQKKPKNTSAEINALFD